MAEFDTLIPDLEKLFQGVDLTERIHHLTMGLGAAFVDRFLSYAEEHKPSLRLSNVGKPYRQLWYELNGFKGEPLSFQSKLKFLYGTICEELVIFLSREAGHTVTDEQKEVTLDGVTGHIDGFIDGVLVDVKSCSTRSFEKFEKGTLFTDDPFGYIAQLSGYAQALGVERAAFLAVDKVLGKICILELTKEVRDKYDINRRITDARKVIASSKEPERCYEPKPISKTDKSGNLVLATGCSYCGFKTYCWRDSNNGAGLQVRYYASGPKWFTKLVKEPRLKYEEDFLIKDNN